MNLMLIDSDQENIKNFKTHIKSSHPSIRIVGSLSDINKNMTSAIKEFSPDMILADIRFFGGLHFIRFKEVHEQMPHIRYIMYGTFNESEYMKKGREFGVLDFMYRPVKPSDLNRALDFALNQHKKDIENRRRENLLEKNYQERLFQYQEIFLRSLLDGHIDRLSEITEGFEYFNIPFDPKSGFSVLLIRIDQYRKMAIAQTEMEKHIRTFKMLTIVQDMLKDNKAQCFIRGFNEIPIILHGSYSVEEKVILADKIKYAIYEYTNTRVSIGIGRTYDKPVDIAISAREADATFGYRYKMGYNSVIPIEFVEPDNKITFRYPSHRERRLIYAAVVGDYNYCKNVLHELFTALSSSGRLSDGLIAKTVATIVFRISRYISELNLPFAHEIGRFFPTGEMLKLANLDDGYNFLDKCLKNFCNFIDEYSLEISNKLHENAVIYIAEHYFESFSIAKIAVKLGTTPENLNKIFMEKEKSTLFDYVMWVRVRAAQVSLVNTDTGEEIIAVQVGFDDVKYFRSIFRKYTGLIPAEYRAKERMA